MKNILKVFTSLFLILSASVTLADNKIFSVKNPNGSITAKSIEKSFNDSGVLVDVNNDMNSIFSKRYNNVHHKKYNLAIFTNEQILLKLIKKYPNIGLITPLSMSIYSNDVNNTINVSTLSLEGMARVTNIPVTDTDLIAYAKSVDVALHKALPNGKYLPLDNKTTNKKLTTEFSMEFELEDGVTYSDLKDAFKDEFEAEIGPVGFLVPKSYSYSLDEYDFFDTYSIIRFNAIYPVSKNHPDAGSYAPFSLVIYKKKDEESVYIKFPSIDNWIEDLGITEQETIDAVEETHNRMIEILEGLTE
ncbi:MAG: hypothetical protein ISR68_01780 [Campylobacterales bacterium]|nr:hypothetical protein [Campylobacterales bacterium]